MNEKIIFEKDGVRITERVDNPITGTEERETITPYNVFENHPTLNWKVKTIRPLTKNGVLTGIEMEIENINENLILNNEKNRSETKYKAPLHHPYDWYDNYVLEVIRKNAPIHRKDIVRGVYEMISNKLYDADFYRFAKSGKARWEVMVRGSVTNLYRKGKLRTTGHNDWSIA